MRGVENMSGFSGISPTPISSNNAAEVRSKLGVPSTSEMNAAIEQSTALTTGKVTWNTQNVTGDTTRCNWFQIGNIVVASLEFTPISGRIVNGYGICSGLPAPIADGYNFVYGGNDQQMGINATGQLGWYFPYDTTTIRRIDITIVYVAAS